jgi:hypothetical protein
VDRPAPAGIEIPRALARVPSIIIFMRRFFLVLLMSLSLFSACNHAPTGVLIALPGAKNMQTHTVRGMNVLEYELDVKYPARDQIHKVSEDLKKLGWKPLSYIYLFPKNASSQVLGWTFFNDPPRQPEWVIYEWTSDWQDAKGNLVTYTFRYKDPASKYQQSTSIVGPGDNRMKITAIYTPAGIAKHKQQMLNPKEKS